MKILCTGRNYVEHIQELNNVQSENPVVFLKPESSLSSATSVKLPEHLCDIHYECELVLKIDKKISINNTIASFKEAVSEWTVGIDCTARQLQSKLKSKGLPWELAKAFQNAAVIGQFVPIPELDFEKTHFMLQADHKILQQATPESMIYDFTFIINFLAQYFELLPGDLIFTGTPKGVGSIEKGIVYNGYISDKQLLTCTFI